MSDPRRSLVHWLSRRVFRLPATKPRIGRAVDDEIEFHVQERVDEFIAAGMSPTEAAAEVRRRFGDISTLRGQLVTIEERARRRSTVAGIWNGLTQDIRFAARSLRRRPAFAATALLTLALGIGATTAMFSVIDGVLLQPLPYREPDRLVTIFTTFPYWKGQPVVGARWNQLRSPYPDYMRLVSGQQVFDGVAGFQVSDASLTVGTETVSINEGMATANLLRVLGTTVSSGRWFLPGEDGTTAQHVAVISHELWLGRFGGEPMLGRTLTLDEQSFTIVGILPPRFSLAGSLIQTDGSTQRADLWIPIGVYPSSLQPNNHTLELIGRLRAGVSLAVAQAVTEPLIRGDRPAARRGAHLVPRDDVETGEVRRPLLLLFASVTLLLLITCGNVATLFLAECAVREPELRTRAVLGAGRARLVRLLLTESAVIAAGGEAGGALLGWWGVRVMLRLAPSELPHVEMIHMSIRVCVFAMGVAGLVAVFAGIVPAFTFTRDGTGVRASGARVAAGRSRLQTSVIAFQSAMSVVLIAGAILLGRSLVNEGRVDPGFRAERMLMMQVDIPRSLAPTSSDDRRLKLFVNDALTSLPGVSRVTAASMPPLSGRTNGQMASPRPSEAMSVSGSNVERMVIFPNYFDALRIPLVAGRRFTEQDVEDGPRVAIVSEAFARRFWPNESAVGKQFRHPNGVPTIVGVVGDVRNKSLDRAAEPVFYLPAMQANARLSFLIETRGEPLAIAAAAQRAVWTAIPGATISEVTSMERLMSRALAPGRYRATLAALFAVIALTLTAVGVAGLAARGVATRLPELCIRIALGATPRRVLALATSRGLGATLAGIVIGLAVTPFTSRWLADYLFQVPVRDATSYFATCGLTAIVCVGATLLATKRLRHADLSAVLRRT